MDITTIRSFRTARTRADLALAEGEIFIAGGTWLMGEPQPEATGFVDLTTLGWPDIEVDETGLRVGATCTIARLVEWSRTQVPPHWRAAAIIPDAAHALLASFKIWNTATVGGNICRSFSAGAMTSLAATLDAKAVVWSADGAERREPVAELMAGNGLNTLARGDVLRAIEFADEQLRSRATLRKIALAELGRSGAVVSGRVDPSGAAVIVITAATLVPRTLRFDRLPSQAQLAAALETVDGWYTDPLGTADWRQGVSAVLAERVRGDLEARA